MKIKTSKKNITLLTPQKVLYSRTRRFHDLESILTSSFGISIAFFTIIINLWITASSTYTDTHTVYIHTEKKLCVCVYTNYLVGIGGKEHNPKPYK